MSQYLTNLTDKQWQVIEKIINPQERQRKHPLREIMKAILYVNRTGCQWRILPSDFAPWQTVYYYFRKWKLEAVIEDIMDTIHSLVRRIIGREESPSMEIIDSRSVKTSHHVDSDRGIDGNKKVKGRKEHIVVDILGIPMAVAVHEASLHDSKGALQMDQGKPDGQSPLGLLRKCCQDPSLGRNQFVLVDRLGESRSQKPADYHGQRSLRPHSLPRGIFENYWTFQTRSLKIRMSMNLN